MLSPAPAIFLLGLTFEPEDEGDIFLPKRRSLSELRDVRTQKIISSDLMCLQNE
jgi:hypothetical protein